MLTVNFLQFILQLIISNFMLKMAAIYTRNTPLGNALAFVA
jgi:hypothetical protein